MRARVAAIACCWAAAVKVAGGVTEKTICAWAPPAPGNC